DYFRCVLLSFFFFQAEDGIRDGHVTGVQTCALPISCLRSVVWAMLRNPAYEGKACYGKTEQSPRQRITRPLRQKNGISNRTNCRSEERRVGKECRSRWSADHEKKKRQRRCEGKMREE